MRKFTGLRVATGVVIGIASVICIAAAAAPGEAIEEAESVSTIAATQTTTETQAPTKSATKKATETSQAESKEKQERIEMIPHSMRLNDIEGMPPHSAYDNVWELSEDDKYLLARMIMAEAESEPLEGQALVGLVILNRVKHPDFPDTVEEVIFEPGQFTPVYNGRWDAVEPDTASWSAVGFISAGWDESEGATYFESSANTSEWHEENLQYLFSKGGHDFYK